VGHFASLALREVSTRFPSAGGSIEEILRQYPALEREDIKAWLEFAAALMDRNYVAKFLADVNLPYYFSPYGITRTMCISEMSMKDGRMNRFGNMLRKTI
jgi:Protein of unknown function (DUF433)